MRPTTSFALHAVLAAAIVALAASSAAASPASLKLQSRPADARSGHDEEIEVFSVDFTPLSRTSKIKALSIKQRVGEAPPRVFVKSWSSSGDAGSVGGAHKESIGAAHSPDTSSGQATGKRTHKPLRMRMEYDGGSVTVHGRFATCRPGAVYDRATIDAGGESYELQDVVVGDCSSGGATLHFAKVKVRGWDPERKE